MWLAGKERERERERRLGHEVEHGVFEVGDSRLVLGRVVVVFRYRIASIFLFGFSHIQPCHRRAQFQILYSQNYGYEMLF